jgi:hypothetical protein
LNGFEKIHQITPGLFKYTFKLKEHTFTISPRGSEDFTLLIDTISFENFTPRAKAAQAALINSYSSSRKTVATVAPPKVAVGQPKRSIHEDEVPLRTGYAPQTDSDDEDEDLFSKPVNVQSFVSPLPVATVPDLITFDEEQKEEAEGSPVTPRNQIDPKVLENPFLIGK